MGRPRDADDDRTVAEDGCELRDAHPIAADEAPHLVPPGAPGDRDLGGGRHAAGATRPGSPALRRRPIHVLVTGVGPENAKWSLETLVPGASAPGMVGEGGLER